MTVEDENPFEAVLRELRADVCKQRTESRLPQRVGPGVNRQVAELVGAAMAVGNCRHHHDAPPGARTTHALRDGARLVAHRKRVGSNGQVRTVLLEHPERQDEQGSSAVERVDLRPRELLDEVDRRRGGVA